MQKLGPRASRAESNDLDQGHAMTAIYVDPEYNDVERRERLYAGDLIVLSPTATTRALCEHARAMIEDAFAPHDPRKVHETMPVDQCVDILSRLKPAFIHDPRSKALIQTMLRESGCDPEKTYFDVPRLRSAMPADYLTSGIAYAFHPHRDTWYSAPQFQLNWWIPVYDIVPENGLAFHPRYFNRGVKNGSANYNYYRWNAQNRSTAAKHIKADTRVQPKPEEPIELEPQIRVISRPGGTIVFSGAQLHSTVPNQTDVVRWSIDFRTVNLDDAVNRRGAPNVDSACTGTTMRDYLRVTDLSHIPDAVVAMYSDGTESEGLLIYPQTPAGKSTTPQTV